MELVSGLIFLYYTVLAAVAVLVIWALVLTIRLLRSVLAERGAREVAARVSAPARGPLDEQPLDR